MNCPPTPYTAIFLLVSFAFPVFGAEQPPLFEQEVRPILKAHCLQCHGNEDQPKAGVDLRLRRFMLRELEDGRHVMVPGKPEESEMLLLVREGEMPKRGSKLKPHEIDVIERWIAGGAPTSREEAAELPPGPLLTDEEKSFWAFQQVKRPPVPPLTSSAWARNPIDSFIAAEHQARELRPRPEASREILLRRVFLDLIGLLPTPAEQDAFLTDTSSDAYDKVVDRLLADPRYGERWARHWMDVWRYSDWAGWMEQMQVRDSHRHIWRWRDWIVESLNADKGYDRMLQEMLAGDELVPGDPDVLRATGFLVRNYKKLSREQWLEDTIKHTSQAFLGMTVGCAKCHDHMYDPISQREYYQLRAVFEPHQARIDPVPGEIDATRDGLARAYDADLDAPSWFLERGDERRPDKTRTIVPGVPRIFGGHLQIAKISLPSVAVAPEKQEFAIRDIVAARAKEVDVARAGLQTARQDRGGGGDRGGGARDKGPAGDGASKRGLDDGRDDGRGGGGDKRGLDDGREISLTTVQLCEKETAFELAHARYQALLATLAAEKLEDAGPKDSPWETAATEAAQAQRRLAVAEARSKCAQNVVAQTTAEARLCELIGAPEVPQNQLDQAEKALTVAQAKMRADENALRKAEEQSGRPLTTSYTPRAIATYPETSTGRRLAFARWLTDEGNPLTARVAVNHVWLRHFGRGIVPTPADFGRNGRLPSHPQLLDWLAAEFMSHHWSMKTLHRLIMTSSAYRMASTADETNSGRDPDNVYLWRMPSRRLEAEAVRDNLLYAAGDLDSTMGGPEIDQQLGLQSKRRSLYLRTAPEREVEFLRIFDGPNVNECYERRPSVTPQQALALLNNELTTAEAKQLAGKLAIENGADLDCFVAAAFRRILARAPTPDELSLCRDFMKSSHSSARAREELLLVLFNHNDFVTVR